MYGEEKGLVSAFEKKKYVNTNGVETEEKKGAVLV